MSSLAVACINWLFGPVLLYDLIRTARRSRYILLRCLYAIFFLLILVSAYSFLDPEFHSSGVPANQMAAFAESFFATFMWVQLAVVVLIAPAYIAGAIAEEKERKTLEFLLATDLRNREIVLGKLASRLANLALLILTGLPILCFLQLLGGVDPNAVLSGFAATGLTMMGMASVSILNSVWLKKARDAIVVTYLMAFAYLVLSAMCLLLLNPIMGLGSVDLSFGYGLVTVQDLVEWLNAGNLVGMTLLDLFQNNGSTTPFIATVPEVLRNYAIFHGLLTAGCVTWAVVRLRAVALKQTYGSATKLSLLARLLGRPRLGDRPMVWKEVFAEPGLRFNWMGRTVIVLLLVASFVPAAWMIVYFISEWLSRSGNWIWESLHYGMNAWVRIVGTLVACLTLLAVAVRAAGSISGERDRQTMDSLLTSPLDSNDILWGKWVGSILSVRWGWLWLGMIWALGIMTGGLHVLALPLVLTAWTVFAAFLAGLGLWFSAVSRTSLRAVIYTLLMAVVIGFAHWVIWMCGIPIMIASHGGMEDVGSHVLMFQSFGLTPPLTLGGLAFQGVEFEGTDNTAGLEMVGCALAGLIVYGFLTVFLATATSVRFRALTGRAPLRRPVQFATASPVPAPDAGHKDNIPPVSPAVEPPAPQDILPAADPSWDDEDTPRHPPTS